MSNRDPSRFTGLIPDYEESILLVSHGGPGTAGIKGDKGDPGEKGERGEPGIGAGENFEFIQSTPSSIWDIDHGLHIFPSVIILDSSGNEVEGAIQYVSNDRLVITFGANFSGTAYLH